MTYTVRDKRGSLDRGFSVKSICAILKASSECGVSELTFGDFHVRFIDKSSTRLVEQTLEETTEFADSTDQETAPQGDGLSRKVPKDLVERFAEEQQLLDDPLAFENQQIDLHLDRSGLDEET